MYQIYFNEIITTIISFLTRDGTYRVVHIPCPIDWQKL